METTNEEFEKEIWEEFEKEIWDEFAKEEEQAYRKDRELKEEYANKLTGLIDVKSLFEYMDDGHMWKPEGIVEIKLTDEKINGYPNHQHARIINDPNKLLYMKTDAYGEMDPIKYYYVWQQTGYIEDDYSGHMLFELSNGKFFKVFYSC